MRLFFDYYRRITADYVPDMVVGAPPALQSHTDLVSIIRLLKDNSDKKRSELTAICFSNRSPDQMPMPTDQNRALDLALRVMTMITCSLEARSADTLEAGLQPAPWAHDMTWPQFISSVFPTTEYSGLEEGAATFHQINDRVTARRLSKVARLCFVPTNELSNHLKLNQKDGTVELFHHTSFLKEVLIASQVDAKSYMSRRIAMEILDSIQKTLFPSTADATILLRSLISKHNLDADCLRFEPSAYQVAGETSSGYRYLEQRLVELYEELDNPTPRGYLEKWLERKSGARYVMMVTLAGVAIAIMLGALALAVSIFQAWVGWQQWKHPVAG
ncbi:hypothetical protein FOQG_16972 [Fusarium oxysporum f. sp. raphani 54005]|uniref:Uncharacterized protein n=1 Tax=Fusarium oxysporum f. sp. raphani 54005 TaxID=1089458 RepID=X0BIP7_FUSOX|nr:hypothetical protein FOQG_16972 [Fusarium oxysporum f. sp. raphani 54005]